VPYLNLDLNYFEHPKTRRLIGLLGRNSEVLPLRLWTYCGKVHAQDGELTGYAPQEIESIVGWWGKSGEMVSAFLNVGFLEKTDKGYAVHEWAEHEGHIVNFHKRAKIAAAARWGDATSNASSNAKSNPKHCPNLTNQPKKKRARGQARGPSPPLPAALDVDTFRSAWERWRTYRRELRRPLTPTGEDGLLRQLAEWGVSRAVAAIEHTIARGWQGIREPDPPGHGAGMNGSKSGGRYMPFGSPGR
jgi:hypothetical protein